MKIRTGKGGLFLPGLCVILQLGAASEAGGAVAALQQAESVAETRALTPSDVARIRSVGEIAIRPDGSAIAYTRSVPREPGRDESGPPWSQLHVVSFDGSADRRLVTGPVNISQISWSPDGAFLSFLARREGDDRVSIYIIPAELGESRRLYQHETDVESYDWRPDGRALSFVAGRPLPEDIDKLRQKGFNQEVYEEDWLGKGLFVLELPNGPGGAAGAMRELEGLPGQPWQAVWSPDGLRLLTDLSPTPLIDDRYMFRRLHVVDATSGAVLVKIANPGKLGEFGWSPDGGTIAMIAAADINDPREGRLVVADADGGELQDLLPDLEAHVAGFQFDPSGRIVYLADIGVGSRVGRVRRDGRDDEVIFEGSDPVIDAISLGDRGRRLALVAESPAMPRELFAMSTDRRSQPQRLSDSNPWLAEVSLAEQEIVSWTASDGLEIEGLLIHPLERSDGGSAPTIVVVHGGPEAHFKNGWLTRYSYPGQMAAARGYAVLYPNYRGSTGRGVAFSKADQGDGVGAEFEDVLAGVDHLIARGVSDPERIGITGGSYGGYFTAWGATRYSDRFAAGVMFVGISDQLSKTGTSDIPKEMELVHWLTNPYDEPDLFLERSPIMYVKQAQTPLLILHGKDDPRVNPGQSRELYRGIKMMTDTPVRLVLYPGEGHGNRRAAAQYDYSLRMLRWFDWFLKEGRSDLPPWRIDYGLEPEVM
ncbi:MAG: S9 family peptidase [Gemmatimonadota bacterium]|nr:MAG: S9 family peptidase [Gemmatimonadota bacterium]